ncbi:MAG: DUF4212 domain-containing protein [Prolixibacteraceae bacterium]|nr:DUF4212 domain-containing protein [Prolixibacteraceae bacterium]
MKELENGFHISFFKPTTKHARANRNMVIWLVCLWIVAIFGFQIALYVFQKPTPEPSLEMYEANWKQVKNNTATDQQLRDFSYAALSVLGKVFIEPGHKAALDKGLSLAVFHLSDSAQSVMVSEQIAKFEGLASSISDITDEGYKSAKAELSETASQILGLDKSDARRIVLPLELVSVSDDELSEGDIALIEEAMPLYLTHNQSFLTDTKFLGFPFHYFYTAVFLLILFVGICWLYCVRTDRINKKLNIAD